MTSMEDSDKAAAAVATAPRVSIADIEASIVGEWYCSGASITTETQDAILTICILRVRNGFTIVGKSAPASPENFNRELGQKFAREDAVRQLWPLMGYALRERLSQG